MSVDTRLDELCVRHGLDERARRALTAVLESLESDPTAPTAVRDPAAAVDVHIADSLIALELPELRRAGTIADLGAGAGFPALPLAVALPGARVAALESSRRKCEFLCRVVDAIGLSNVEVVAERAEAWAAGFGRQDVVTARALAPLSVLAEYAAPLLRLGGLLVAWKGDVGSAESGAGAEAAEHLGLDALEVRAVAPYLGSRHRTLHLYRKTRETPPGFPRPPGRARKRPLA